MEKKKYLSRRNLGLRRLLILSLALLFIRFAAFQLFVLVLSHVIASMQRLMADAATDSFVGEKVRAEDNPPPRDQRLLRQWLQWL